MQLGGGTEGVFRYDARAAAEAGAVWGCVHTCYRSHGEGIKTLELSAGKTMTLLVYIKDVRPRSRGVATSDFFLKHLNFLQIFP